MIILVSTNPVADVIILVELNQLELMGDYCIKYFVQLNQLGGDYNISSTQPVIVIITLFKLCKL